MSYTPYELAALMSRYLKNELNAQELHDFQALLKERPEYGALLESFKDTRQVQEEIEFMAGLDVEKAWSRVRRRNWIQRHWKPLMGAAASLLLLLTVFVKGWSPWQEPLQLASGPVIQNDLPPASNRSELILSDGQVLQLDEAVRSFQEKNGTLIRGQAGVLAYQKSGAESAPEQQLIYNTLRVPAAGTYALLLPDGSKVWINALSELRFPVQFGANSRRVYLKGEAYFEVAKDAGRPFIVEVADSRIEVLGTHFNVRGFDETVAATLIEGSVQVESNAQKALLYPGQQAVIRSGSMQVQPADTYKATAWKNKLFYFEGESIQQVMQEIARWYNVEVRYQGKLPQDTYKGIIQRDVPLSKVLEMLQFMGGIDFEVSGQTVNVKF